MFGETHQHCSMAKPEASVENVTGVVRMLSTLSGNGTCPLADGHAVKVKSGSGFAV